MTNQNSINKYLEASIAGNWEHLALTDFQGVSFQYRDVARKVAKLHLLYEHAGIKHGDKIALCGKNSSQWAIALIATLTYGAVAVPILHDFKPDNVQHLVTHSEAKLLLSTVPYGKSRPGLDGIAGGLAYAERLLAAVLALQIAFRGPQDPEPVVRRPLPRALYPGRRQVFHSQARRPDADKLHLRLYRILQGV